MKRVAVILAVLLSAGVALAVEMQGFERYRVIIDRAPFGKVDVSAVSATSSNFMARFAFVGLVGSKENAIGLQAVILDKKTNQSYFKTPGETLEDVTIVRIEEVQPKRRLVLRRGLEIGALIFGEGGAKSTVSLITAGAPDATDEPPANPPPAQPVARRRNPFVR